MNIPWHTVHRDNLTSIFSKIIIELYEKVGKICLRRYREISQKIINFCKIPFLCKNSDQSQLI